MTEEDIIQIIEAEGARQRRGRDHAAALAAAHGAQLARRCARHRRRVAAIHGAAVLCLVGLFLAGCRLEAASAQYRMVAGDALAADACASIHDILHTSV